MLTTASTATLPALPGQPASPARPACPTRHGGPAPAPAPASAPEPVRAPVRGRGVARWAVEPTVAAVPLVRTRVRVVLEGWRVAAEVVDVLLLAVSELAGNVVQHAATNGRMRVAMVFDGGWLRLEVADQGVRPLRLPHAAAGVDPESESGRGLLIIQLLAAEAGGELSVATDDFGTSVRVVLPAG
ncbi:MULTISPECIES: ATP-binding protein [unclassified Streptomyces]|uniref:ATP-binding protein n=1 Tax=unclassified Streptomyces TaxID=2593676 RepID=UPI002E2AD9CF|nr:ATP-binding protein [Streptomyces sp. NBC_00272]